MMIERSVLAAAALAVVLPAGGALAQAGPKPVPRAAFTATMEGQFRAIDTNKDNVATVAEIEAYQRAQGAAMIQRQTDAAFAKLDTNNDGSISRAEFAKVSNGATIKPNSAPMIAQMDANKDGKISIAEFRAAAKASFDKLDTNKDGIVSPDEFRAGQPRR